jgi:alginate O-acetyltransferase complex protein AlgI
MVFSSHIFIFYFLPLVLGVYYLMHWRGVNIHWMNLFISVTSYVFYGWFEPWFVILMFGSTVVDYAAGRIITAPGATIRRRNIALGVSMTSNLALLGFFKYYMFFMGGLNHLLGLLGAGPHYYSILAITLPVGISFYTFQSMSYTIDVWRGDAPPVRDLRTFTCFVALFPQLVAGPIIRYNTVANQLERRHHTLLRFVSGIVLFSLGMGQKILLANSAGQIADSVFAADSPGMLLSWWGILAYTMQIFFDFNGYSNMAVGLGRMLGFEFIRNFNAPYRSRSITDFWKRWHMSLTTWFTDYLYISIGGNRVKSKLRLYFNLFLVMFISGLWHGANLTFVAWGMFHAFFLISERLLDKKPFYEPLPLPIKILLTNLIVMFAWVLFRSPDLGHALEFWKSMVGAREAMAAAPLLGSLVFEPYLVFCLICAVVLTQLPWQAHDFAAKITWPRLLVATVVLVLSLVTMFTQAFNPFLYFQF